MGTSVSRTKSPCDCSKMGQIMCSAGPEQAPACSGADERLSDASADSARCHRAHALRCKPAAEQPAAKLRIAQICTAWPYRCLVATPDVGFKVPQLKAEQRVLEPAALLQNLR